MYIDPSAYRLATALALTTLMVAGFVAEIGAGSTRSGITSHSRQLPNLRPERDLPAGEPPGSCSQSSSSPAYAICSMASLCTG
jgi:hypothetical protein